MSFAPITRPSPVDRALRFLENPEGDVFLDVALDVFAFQFEHNRPYRRLCQHRGATPDSVRRLEEIPVVPTSAFKDHDLTCGTPRRVFVTSGTTRGDRARGRHLLPETLLYEVSWEGPFRRHVLGGHGRRRILSLVPGPRLLPESSLSWMVARAMERFGTPESLWILDERIDPEDALIAMTRADEPVIILGTALGLAEPLEDMARGGRSLVLPPGTRIMDTGGFKGRRREVERVEMLDLYRSRLGVGSEHVVGEYGMTELCSQFYEVVAPDGSRPYVGPAWTRTRVLDPETLNEVPDGERGLLAHLDLANAWTVSAVVTEDVGRRVGDGFIVEGRAAGAELRGCSLATEELLGR